MNDKFVILVYVLMLLASTIIPIPSEAAENVQTIVYVNPPTVQVVPGETFTINVCISNVTDLWAWQVYLTVDDTILNVTGAWFPEVTDPDYVFYGRTIVRPAPAFYDADMDGNMEAIKMGECILTGDPFTGSGKLGVIELQVKKAPEEGETLSCVLGIDNAETYLLDFGMSDIPCVKEDGYVTAEPVPHDVAIVSVTPSATEVFAGQTVNLDVVTKNVGTTTESFNVTACYNSHVIGTKALTDIAPSEETALQFQWNTSDVLIGTYVIKVLASVVPGEIILKNNIYVDSTIKIKSAYDLSVSVEAPSRLPTGESGLLKATISNVGWKDVETDIELQLLIDENIVNETIISKLAVGASEEITYWWTPTVVESHIVKAYAPPISGEKSTLNNVATRTVAISRSEMPTVQVETWRDYVRVGELVRVHICVYDVTNLYAWQIKIWYNHEILEFRKIWLPDNHVFVDTDYIAPHPKVGEDYVIYGASLVGVAQPFNGSGTLCKIDFKAKATGSSSLELDDTDSFLLNSDLNSISFQIVNSQADIFGDTIEITNLETSRTEVYTGWIIEVNVTVRNNGYMPQTFSVTAYFASEIMVTQKVFDLPPGEKTTLTFHMDTSILTPYIEYVIWAEAAIVIEETWAYNNFFFWGVWGFWEEAALYGPLTVKTRTVPDINGDKKVDIRDVGIAALAFGSNPEHRRWNLLADMNQDDKVDIRDLALVAKNFGKNMY